MSEIAFWTILAVLLPVMALSLALVYTAILIVWAKRKTEAENTKWLSNGTSGEILSHKAKACFASFLSGAVRKK